MELISTIDMTKIPTLVGTETREKAKSIINIVAKTRWPLYFVGPSGCGKTIMAFNIAKAYSKIKNVPAYYVQLSPEQTKSTLILGLRLVNGSLVVQNGIVAECMEKGGIIIVDEATHGSQELLLMFNSILDRTSVTAIGDKVINSHDNFRVIFCSNNSSYAGNVKLPQSFAQRLAAFNFEYPSYEEEVEITQNILKDEYNGTNIVPDEVIKYVVNTMRDIRTNEFPLSVRNSAIAIVLLNFAKYDANKNMAPYFSTSNNAESIRRNIADRIGLNLKSTSDLDKDEINIFCNFVSRIGIDQFKEVILSSFMYYLDIDTGLYASDDYKTKIIAKII